jgi:hypothetical protein
MQILPAIITSIYPLQINYSQFGDDAGSLVAGPRQPCG